LSEITVRPGTDSDLAPVGQIQAASPEAAQWPVLEYLQYDLVVAECDLSIAGFGVARRLVEGESELLNLAVDPAFRGRGIGRRLAAELISRHSGVLWLEVRETNVIARNLYKSLGFNEIGYRPDYYLDSSEGAIVMNVHS